MTKKDPRFKVGNVVSVYFDSPSLVGYNGTSHIVEQISWSEKHNQWRYMLKSVNNGFNIIFALESEMRFQAERHFEPWHLGTCVIEIGD